MRNVLRRYNTGILGAILGLLAAGTIVNFLLIGGALDRLSKQASDGRLAHERQCKLYPVNTKLYEAAQRYHLITQKELDTYLSFSPQGCRTNQYK